MIEAVSRIEQAVLAARPFAEAIRNEQRQKVFSVLADTICRNASDSADLKEGAEVAETLGVPMQPSIKRHRRQIAARAAYVANLSSGADASHFTTKPELLALFSSFTNAAETGNKEELSSFTTQIIASKNASLIFVAMKTPGADDSIYDLAVALGTLGHFEYMAKTFAIMEPRTPASRALARAIAYTCPAAMIADLYTIEGVEEGTMEAYYFASALAKTRDYKSILDAYTSTDGSGRSREYLMLCRALASSGDIEIIDNALKETKADNGLAILNCGMRAASIYSKIRDALNKFRGR